MMFNRTVASMVVWSVVGLFVLGAVPTATLASGPWCCFTTDVDSNGDRECINAASAAACAANGGAANRYYPRWVCNVEGGFSPKEGDYCVQKSAISAPIYDCQDPDNDGICNNPPQFLPAVNQAGYAAIILGIMSGGGFLFRRLGCGA